MHIYRQIQLTIGSDGKHSADMKVISLKVMTTVSSCQLNFIAVSAGTVCRQIIVNFKEKILQIIYV